MNMLYITQRTFCTSHTAGPARPTTATRRPAPRKAQKTNSERDQRRVVSSAIERMKLS